jgi:hypothetical protein
MSCPLLQSVDCKQALTLKFRLRSIRFTVGYDDEGNGDVLPISEGHSRYPSIAMPLQTRQSCSETTWKPPRVSESYGLK